MKKSLILCAFYGNKVHNFYPRIFELISIVLNSDNNSETKVNDQYYFITDFTEAHESLVTYLKSQYLAQ